MWENSQLLVRCNREILTLENIIRICLFPFGFGFYFLKRFCRPFILLYIDSFRIQFQYLYEQFTEYSANYHNPRIHRVQCVYVLHEICNG